MSLSSSDHARAPIFSPRETPGRPCQHTEAHSFPWALLVPERNVRLFYFYFLCPPGLDFGADPPPDEPPLGAEDGCGAAVGCDAAAVCDAAGVDACVDAALVVCVTACDSVVCVVAVWVVAVWVVAVWPAAACVSPPCAAAP